MIVNADAKGLAAAYGVYTLVLTAFGLTGHFTHQHAPLWAMLVVLGIAGVASAKVGRWVKIRAASPKKVKS